MANISLSKVVVLVVVEAAAVVAVVVPAAALVEVVEDLVAAAVLVAVADVEELEAARPVLKVAPKLSSSLIVTLVSSSLAALRKISWLQRT